MQGKGDSTVCRRGCIVIHMSMAGVSVSLLVAVTGHPRKNHQKDMPLGPQSETTSIRYLRVECR